MAQTSDVPTILIGPKDYQNLYQGARSNKDRVQQISVQSEIPTAILAPNDYKDLYHAKKNTQKGDRALEAIPSEAPTILHGPKDYVNYYTNKDKATSSSKNGQGGVSKKAGAIPSDAPTTLVLELKKKQQRDARTSQGGSKNSKVSDTSRTPLGVAVDKQKKTRPKKRCIGCCCC